MLCILLLGSVVFVVVIVFDTYDDPPLLGDALFVLVLLCVVLFSPSSSLLWCCLSSSSVWCFVSPCLSVDGAALGGPTFRSFFCVVVLLSGRPAFLSLPFGRAARLFLLLWDVVVPPGVAWPPPSLGGVVFLLSCGWCCIPFLFLLCGVVVLSLLGVVLSFLFL